EELTRLPEACRAPLLLCGLGGLARDEAARRLGCSLATLKRRLAHGRRLLRARLARRGLALGAASGTSLLTQGTWAATVPARLTASTTRAARTLAAVGAPPCDSIPSRVLALAEGAARSLS